MQDPLLLQSDRLIAEGDRHFEAQAFAEAAPCYRGAIALCREALGEQDERVAVAINRLANVYYKLKDDASAGELFEQALAIREAVLPADAAELRLSVNNLANTYRNQGRFAEAEILYRRSLKMRERQTGHENHPEIWRNLVRVLEGQGKLDEAAYFAEKTRTA